MVVLVAGLRTLGANWDNSDLGYLANQVGVLDNSWFVNLLNMDNEWKPIQADVMASRGPGEHAPDYEPHDDDKYTGHDTPLHTGLHGGGDGAGHDVDGAHAGVAGPADYFVGIDRATGKPKYHASRADLVFGSNSVLRAQSEFYGSDDAKEKFVRDFVKAWVKVMNADRYDVPGAAIELTR